MNSDLEEQQDELLALQSIFDPEEFIRNESESTGEIRVSVELPEDFNVVLKQGETPRQYDILFLPPIFLTFELPDDYPSSSPPSFSLTCSWLTHAQLAVLSAQLTDLFQATGGAVVLFSWVQFLKEDTLKILDIHSLLELPFDKQSSSGAEEDSHKAQQINTSSLFSQGSLMSDFQTDYSKALSTNFTTIKQNERSSDLTASQASRFRTDNKNDLPSAAEQSDIPESVQIGQKEVFNQLDNPDPTFPITSSSEPIEKELTSSSAQLPDVSTTEESTASGFSLTPSQKLLSQILIHDAAQRQKVFAATVFTCGVCYMDWLGSECVQLHECGHVFCRACLSEFCKVQIKEGNVRGVTCPQAGCRETPTPAQVKNLVGDELFSRYDRLLLQSTLDGMPDVTYCPRHSCGSAVILEDANTATVCSVCRFAFCIKCKKSYHGTNKCYDETADEVTEDTFEALPRSEEGIRALMEDYTQGSMQRRRVLEQRYGRHVFKDNFHCMLCKKWIDANTQACPHCFCNIQKDGGCDIMTCTQCGRYFIWK